MSEERVTVADGKYTVINDNGKLTALRNGEPWCRDLVGDNLVYWMLVEIRKLQDELHALAAPGAEAAADGAEYLGRSAGKDVLWTGRAVPAAQSEAPAVPAACRPALPDLPGRLFGGYSRVQMTRYAITYGNLCANHIAALAAAPTAPAVAVPLMTDEQIATAWEKWPHRLIRCASSATRFVRSIAACGVKS